MSDTDTFHPGRFIRDLLKAPSDRDRQVVVGASNLSNPCARCLANDMIATGPSGSGRYWLGAVIGTAIHSHIEERVNALGEDRYIPESKVVLGEIDGYGVVKSTSDLFDVLSGTVVDAKTTTRDKLKFIKRALEDPPHELEPTLVAEARHKVNGYIYQLLLYGKGQVNAGRTVKRVALVFICRDGKGDEDIWSWSMDYDPEEAERVWDRGVRLWAWLQDGNDPATLPSALHCWTCNQAKYS